MQQLQPASFALGLLALFSACSSEPEPPLEPQGGSTAVEEPGASSAVDTAVVDEGGVAEEGGGEAAAIGLALLLPDELESELGPYDPNARPEVAHEQASGGEDFLEESEAALDSVEAEPVLRDALREDSQVAVGGGGGGSFGGRRSRQGGAAPTPGPAGPSTPGPPAAARSAPSSDLAGLGYGPSNGAVDARTAEARGIPATGGLAFSAAGELADGASPADEEELEPWQKSGAGVNATRLRVGDEDELPLLGMQATVWVEGFRARVVLDCMYHNDRGQNLEGDFRIRLPEGASPYYFAFGGSEEREGFAPELPLFDEDVEGRRRWTGRPQLMREERAALWSEPKEARMVARERAAFAYGETVRRQVDPALLEWAGAGVFHARVFPLMPGSQARIVLGYELDLQRVQGGLGFDFEVPADVPELSMDLFVPTAEGDVLVLPQTDPWSDGVRTHYSWPRTELRGFSLRKIVLGALGMSSPQSVDEDWFALQLEPELPRDEDRAGGPAVIAIDTSLSSRASMARWAEFVPLLLEENRETLTSFAVLFFDVEQRWWKREFTPNQPGAVDELRRELQSVWLEGASDLQAGLAAASAPEWQGFIGGRPWDVFVFSDGAPTWGESDRHALLHAFQQGAAGKLFAYTAGAAAAPASLQHVARESGGAVFHIAAGEGGLRAAASAHRFTPWVIEDVRLTGASDLLLAGRPTSLYPGQTVQLVGRGRPRAGQVVEFDLTRSGVARNLRVRVHSVVESELAARAYGAVACAQLEEWGTALEEQAVPFARHFRITGDSCSLLMLESEEDYERFEIEQENDALVVRSTQVPELVAQLVALRGAELSDPQRGLLAWLERLADAPGVQWQAPEGFFEAFGALDAEQFRVSRAALASRTHDGSDLTPDLVAGLESGEPAYDALLAAAEARLADEGAAGALRLFSSLVELNAGDGVVARDVGFAEMGWGLPDHAYHLFRRVSAMRPYEPQSYHAMARCMEAVGRVELAQLWYEVALAGTWQGRFGNFDEICGLDYLRLLRRIQSGAVESRLVGWSRARLPEVQAAYQPEQADVLVTITWNTDRTDVDLHVREPTGEVCYYSNKNTAIGGRLTRDVTQGYGPEMYVLENAVNGDYRILAHYFRSDANRTNVRTKVYARVYLGWGTQHEEVRDVVVPLTEGGQYHDVAVVRCEK